MLEDSKSLLEALGAVLASLQRVEERLNSLEERVPDDLSGELTYLSEEVGKLGSDDFVYAIRESIGEELLDTDKKIEACELRLAEKIDALPLMMDAMKD